MSRPGPDRTPPTGGDFGDFLRHALHTAADQIEPRPDGLERIRARVRTGPAHASKHSRATARDTPGSSSTVRIAVRIVSPCSVIMPIVGLSCYGAEEGAPADHQDKDL